MSNTCKFKACIKTATYGFKKNDIKYCKNHALDKMINLDNKICQYKNCRQKSVFGHLHKDSKKMYCKNHKMKNMINLLNYKHSIKINKNNITRYQKNKHVIYEYSAKLLFSNQDFESQLFMYVV